MALEVLGDGVGPQLGELVDGPDVAVLLGRLVPRGDQILQGLEDLDVRRLLLGHAERFQSR